jgi:phosphoribosylformimino-5-aminoimidazole carboxamide ribonucleotide (ProFAR) isomerase
MESSATCRKSVFRPCIDLHEGQVKQIVGGTLSDNNTAGLKTNFIARLVQSSIFSLIATLSFVLDIQSVFR